jgi:hypothetical protein
MGFPLSARGKFAITLLRGLNDEMSFSSVGRERRTETFPHINLSACLTLFNALLSKAKHKIYAWKEAHNHKRHKVRCGGLSNAELFSVLFAVLAISTLPML